MPVPVTHAFGIVELDRIPIDETCLIIKGVPDTAVLIANVLRESGYGKAANRKEKSN